MEMMVVLLIVAILAAATAPMVTKKMARNAGSGDSPWVFTGLSNDISYNMNGGNSTAIIGATQYNAAVAGAPTHPRLVLANGDANQPALVFADSNGNYNGQIIWNDSKVAMNNFTMGNNSVAFGMHQTIGNSYNNVTVVGDSAQASASNATAIGYGSKATGSSAISIGYQNNDTSGAVNTNTIAIGNSALASNLSGIALGNSAKSTGSSAIAIGFEVVSNGENSVAIGYQPRSTGINSVAIGSLAKAQHNGSVAIGLNAQTTASSQIVLGDPNTTVYIPGHLVVDKYTRLSQSAGYFTMLHRYHARENAECIGVISDKGIVKVGSGYSVTYSNGLWSDRRLKNVGEKYTAGLDELKKLEFFHYTFKKDEAKTPRVGVMAQDLQKVFPDAVTEGEDGYLQIRWEDMFYAVINAVKELDTKISEIVENITSLSKKIDEQQQLIETQQTLIEELQKQNVDLEKRLMKLEKRAK